MIFQTFKKLLGDGRAWRLVNPNIRALVFALVKPFKDIRRASYRVVYAPFLTQNPYASAAEQLADVENYENLFGLQPISNVLSERQSNAEVQWTLRGGQGFGYIEHVMKRAGIPVKVIENIPARDLSNLGFFEYGLTQYGEYVNDINVQYGSTGYRLIGNGSIYHGGDFDDPVKITRFDKVLIIKVLAPLTYGQYKLFTDLLIRTKPMEIAALCELTLY